ncbi:Serine/threonine-protein kinase StkP [Gemmata sp. SH-PL17]|uniref:serine/threonine-protein kinase n=1 Tax=Gemmata sp. SH-PL17 TaxID=1630693 RepID=UPI0004B354D3|nr:serine/threonine-protein kinase [Gemmata sp. SH-PL17]AMV26402.1 Serine/threonine-protein kinase StkP [Gemmata sp. SH-PL17]
MHLDSAEDLMQALRVSGLFTPEQLRAVTRVLNSFGADLQGGMRYIVHRELVTRYQLGKIFRGKVADLIVGPYVVLDKIGEGGMGKVFRARHVQLDRTVALKVIRPGLVTNPTVRGRYAREVQATGKLNHPNVVRVDDAGEIDGKFYLAMEFVDGIDLSRMIRDYRSLEVIEVCEYARQAALGLQNAHEHGLVHRDVKPSNIVVAGERHLPQATEPAVVKVLDLGLARAIDPDDMVSPDLTRDHTVVGTPDYMAPEQARNSKLVDARADLYSLGCTVYFLLTGNPPFPNGGPIEKLIQHQTNHPPALQSVRPDVPAGVAELIAKLMAKKPGDRFATAGEFAAAIEPFTIYPVGAPAVPVIAVSDGSTNSALSEDTHPPRSTLAPASGSSIGTKPLLDIPPEPAPVPQQIAPSDKTPRPSALEEPLAVIEPSPVRAVTNRPSAIRRSAAKAPPAPVEAPMSRALKWVLIGVAVLVLVVLAIWAATLGPAPEPNSQSDVEPGTTQKLANRDSRLSHGSRGVAFIGHFPVL